MTHFKSEGLQTVTSKAIQQACQDNKDIINTVCEKKKKLDEKQAHLHCEHTEQQLALHPQSYN